MIVTKKWKKKRKRGQGATEVTRYGYDFVRVIDGQRKRFDKFGFNTKREAEEAEALKKEEVKSKKATVNLQEIIDERLEALKATKSKGYYDDNRSFFNRIPSQLLKMRYEQVPPDKMSQFFLGFVKSPHAHNYYRRLARALHNYAVDNYEVISNPFSGIKKVGIQKKKKYIPPSRDYALVLEVATCEEFYYLEAVRLTAGRIGSKPDVDTGINGLKWSDVEFEKRQMTIWTRKKKDGNLEPITIEISDYMHEILQRRLKERHPDCPYVFWQIHPKHPKKPIRYQYRDKLLPTLCFWAGVKPFTFHALRHLTSSQLFYVHGAPLGKIQQYLGHENPTTTEKYLQSLSDSVNELMNLL
jgi:integrase